MKNGIGLVCVRLNVAYVVGDCLLSVGIVSHSIWGSVDVIRSSIELYSTISLSVY